MRQLWVPWLLLLLVACRDKAPAEGALQVSVLYGSYTPGCVRVVARDGQGHEGRKDIPQSQFQPRDTRQLRVAVFRQSDWGRELAVEVSSHQSVSGEECAGTPVEVRASAGPVPIPQGDFARIEVTLQAKDGDGDTFLQKEDGVAGTDCDDGRRDVHPGATELCSVNVDFDCNGSKGCQDSACQNKACDDGRACTTGDHCQGSGASAACVGQEVQCTPPTGACLRGAQCDPGTGQCVNLAKDPGTSCDDSNPCTVNDQCGAQAQCAGTPMSCNTPPSMCHEPTGTCNTASGVCGYAVKAAMASCDDAVACTVNDVCDGAGGCQGTPTPCTASSVCKRVTGGCTAQSNCTEEPDPAKVNTLCMINASRAGVCRTQDGVCSTFPYVPSNFNPDTVPLANIGTLSTTCAVTFDSGDMSWTPSSCVANPPQPVVMAQDGTEMVLLAMSSLSLGADLILRGTRPVILAVYGHATLTRSILANGTIVAGTPVPGAGGNQGCVNRRGTNGGLSNSSGGGGGGAGGGSAGAAGASGVGPSAGGAGGGAGSPGGAGFVPLEGGCPGGSGGGGAVEAGKAGAGGGAVQLSVAGTLSVNQWITTSGGGGGGGQGSTTSNGQAGGGGGGGSGGRVLLEAHRLILAGSTRLTANGGGGGEGGGYLDSSTRSTGSNGEDGARSSTAPAVGGNGGSYSGGEGGAGGAGAVGPVMGAVGDSVTGSKGGGGGGGGSVGHIRLRSVEACSINGAVISPSTNTTCPL